MILPFALALLAAAADPGGYSKSRWGMTEQQVLDSFAGQAVRPETPLPDCTLIQDGRRIPASLTIPAVQLGPTAWRACFYFTGEKLSRVDLIPVDRTDADPSEFSRLEAALVEKYGKPWRSRDQHGFESRWSFPATRIKLYLLTVGRALISLRLTYEQSKPADNL